ncbi:hypothetical protein CXT76_01820 [Candidatus Parvarchaeota archaeon]|nr:MAG: hypothetical protein CXT76_01820 [Candidatus Parvarchaeota archaeon]
MKKLNFGCGVDIKKNWDNIDIHKNPKLTKSFDFNKFPYPIKDNSYDYIYVKHVLEHLWEPEKVLRELWRICKPDSIIEILVPHCSNSGAYDGFQHIRYFNEHSFKIFVYDSRRIENKEKFKILKLYSEPSKIGKFFPGNLRSFLSLFINGFQKRICVKLKVTK